jgi:hypothetical protein
MSKDRLRKLPWLIESSRKFKQNYKNEGIRNAWIPVDESHDGWRKSLHDRFSRYNAGNANAEDHSCENVARIVQAQINSRKTNQKDTLQQCEHAHPNGDERDAHRDGRPQHGMVAWKRPPGSKNRFRSGRYRKRQVQAEVVEGSLAEGK